MKKSKHQIEMEEREKEREATAERYRKNDPCRHDNISELDGTCNNCHVKLVSSVFENVETLILKFRELEERIERIERIARIERGE